MNKTVLITGGASGIGKEIAKLFAQKGYNVVITYKKSEKEAENLIDTFNRNNINALAFFCDFSKPLDISHIKEKITHNFNGIDILVNNAAVSYQSLFTSIDEKQWDEVFNVNVKAPFLLTKSLVPYMINNKFGRIINISSILGVCGGSCEVDYSSSKAALIGFTKSLAKELGPSNITVNCIAPGYIDTKMNQNVPLDTVNSIINNTPLNKLGTPWDIASAVYFLASNYANFITGQVISVDGGLFNI